MKRLKPYLLFIATFLTLCFLFLTGFLPRLTQAEKIAAQAEATPPINVSCLLTKAEEAPVSLILPSTTQANHITPIWARANGYLNKLMVDIGDAVQEGQLLAALDTPELDSQYHQAIFDVESALRKCELAKLIAERGEQAFKTSHESISKEELDQRRLSFLVAQADLQAARANRDRYYSLMEFKNIIAPFTGIIIERNVDIGSLISAGSNGTPQQLFAIAACDPIRVFVSVPQSYCRSIHEGVQAYTTIREFPNHRFPCRVVRYSKSLDPVSHTMLTELHIDNKQGTLMPGLYADVTFLLKPSAPYFIVPATALIIRESNPKIAVVDDDNHVHLRTVKIGVDYGKNVQIIEGLQPNEKIVVNPTEKIREGAQVAVI